MTENRITELWNKAVAEIGDATYPKIISRFAEFVADEERVGCAKVCRDLADSCRKVSGWASVEMMQAYEYAEAGILKRSNGQLEGKPACGRSPRSGGSATGGNDE